MTKLEKAQLDREKLERERLAQMTSKTGLGGTQGSMSAAQPRAEPMLVDG